MFGFSVKTLQNGFGSPKSPNAGASATGGDVGEIDTRAPFESVKAAVSLFGDVISPKGRPLAKKTKAEEEKLVEKETRHHVVTKQLDQYKDELRNIEGKKADAEAQLQRANATLHDLTTKLENLSESKQAAIKATEAAKRRAEELQAQQSLKAQDANDAWRLDLDAERERYKALSGDLIFTKQELTNLRQDFDAALVSKLAAFQAIEDAQQSAKRNLERQGLLEKEVGMVREAVDRVKLDSIQAQEEHLKLVAEKEVYLLVHKSAKEAAQREINSLREEYGPDDNLLHKLEETTEAIKVLQEQLNDVRASDMRLLETAALELDRAKKDLHLLTHQQTSLAASVEELTIQHHQLKTHCLELETNASQKESRIEQLQLELDTIRAELELVSTSSTPSVIQEMESTLLTLLAETQRRNVETDEMRKQAGLVREEAEATRIKGEEIDANLETALEEAQEAKAAQKLAEDQLLRNSTTRIRLSIEEFESMNQKLEECRKKCDSKLGALMADLENIEADEKQVLEKVDKLFKDKEEIEAEMEQVIKRLEMEEDAKNKFQIELDNLRLQNDRSPKNLDQPTQTCEQTL